MFQCDVYETHLCILKCCFRSYFISVTSVFLMAQQHLMIQGLLIIKFSWKQSHTPHSVRLFSTSDQHDSKTFTWQHAVPTRNKYSSPRWNSNPKSKQRAAADTRRRPRGQRDRPLTSIALIIIWGEDKDYCLMKCDSAQLGREIIAFRRNLLPLSSASQVFVTNFLTVLLICAIVRGFI